jgi:hypothetical protein
MPQRFGFDGVPGAQAFGGFIPIDGELKGGVSPRFALGSELSDIRSIEPDESTRRRTLGSGRLLVPAICPLASLANARSTSDTTPIVAPRATGKTPR